MSPKKTLTPKNQKKPKSSKATNESQGIDISKILNKTANILSNKKLLLNIFYFISMLAILYVAYDLRSGALNADYFSDPDAMYFFMRGEQYAECGQSVCSPGGYDYLRQAGNTSGPLPDVKFHLMSITLVGIHKIIEPFTGITLQHTFINHLPYLTVLLLIVLFFIGKTLFNTPAGIITAGLGAVSSSSLFRSSASAPDHDLFGAFFIMLSLYYFIKYFKEDQNQIKATIFIIIAGVFTLLTPLAWNGSQPYITIPITGYFVIKSLFYKVSWRDLLNVSIFAFLSAIGMLLNVIPSITFAWTDMFKIVAKNMYIDLLLGVVLLYLALILIEKFRLDEKFKINSKILAIGATFMIGCISLFVLGGFNFSMFSSIIDKIISPVRGVGGSGEAVVGFTVAENQAVSFGNLWATFNSGYMPFIPNTILSFFMPFALMVYGFLIYLFTIGYRTIKTQRFNLTYQEIFLITLFLFSVYAALGGSRMFFVFSWVVGIFTAMFFYLTHTNISKLIEKQNLHSDDKKLANTIITGLFVSLFVIIFYAGLNVANASKVTMGYTKQAEGYNVTAYKWIRENTNTTDVIGHWWDYGYWTEYLGRRPVHVDGGGSGDRYEVAYRFMTTPDEEEAYQYCKDHNIEYFMMFPSDLGKFAQMVRIGQREGGFGVLGDPRTQVGNNIVYNVYRGGITKPTKGLFEDLYGVLAVGKSTNNSNSAGISTNNGEGVGNSTISNLIGNISEVKLNLWVIQNNQLTSQTGDKKLKYLCTSQGVVELENGVDNGCFYYINESINLFGQNDARQPIEYSPIVYSSPANMVGLRLILFNGKGTKHFELVHLGDPINDGGSMGQIKIFKVVD